MSILLSMTHGMKGSLIRKSTKRGFSFSSINIYDYVEVSGYLDKEQMIHDWGRVVGKDEEWPRHILHSYKTGEKIYVSPACVIARTCKFGHHHVWHDVREEWICPWCDINE